MNPARVTMYAMRAARSLGLTLAAFRALSMAERVAWCCLAEWDEYELSIREWLGKQAEAGRAR